MFSNIKIANLCLVIMEEDVGRFDIAMDDVRFMEFV
jgi:hypothetical protein